MLDLEVHRLLEELIEPDGGERFEEYVLENAPSTHRGLEDYRFTREEIERAVLIVLQAYKWARFERDLQ